MQKKLKLMAVASGLFMVTGLVSANDNPAQLEADCMIQKRIAENVMQNRLDGLSKAKAERGLDTGGEDKVNEWWRSITDKAYAYDTTGANSLEAFQKEIQQDCMQDG